MHPQNCARSDETRSVDDHGKTESSEPKLRASSLEMKAGRPQVNLGLERDMLKSKPLLWHIPRRAMRKGISAIRKSVANCPALKSGV